MQKKPALLIIDMCRDFFREGRLLTSRKRLCNATNTLARSFRQSGHPVIWVRQEFKADLSDAFLSMRQQNIRITIEGTDGAKLLAELDIGQNDFDIIKKRYSAFYQTSLDDLLKKLSVNVLVLAGVNTHACIRTAAVDGFQRDFEIVIADEAVDSYDQNFHDESRRYIEGRVGTFMSNSEILSRFLTA